MSNERKPLTVAKLIEELRALPQNAETFAVNACGDGKGEIDRVGMENGQVLLLYCLEGLEYPDR